MDTIKKVISVILSVSIICSMIPLVNGTVYGAETEQLSYAGNGSETEKILPQEKDGTTYLFLPAEADYEALKLAVAEGVTLQGTVEGERLDSSDINGKAVDLTVLFGTMEPGKAYLLSVYNGETLVKTITLMKSANLPSMHITLDTKDLSYIHQDKENKDTGQMVYKTGDDEITVPLARLKGRGNSSWTGSGEKRPYNIKLDSKKELIAGAGKAKDWCLLSNNCYDRTGINNYVAYNLYEGIGGSSALKTQNIDLYINHEYRGTYFLTEKVEIKDTRVAITETEYAVEDEKSRTLVTKGNIENLVDVHEKKEIRTDGIVTWQKVPEGDPALTAGVQAYQYATKAKVDIPGGFLLETDSIFHQEASWFITRRGTTIVVKEPEFASKEQVQQIAIYVQEFEDALYAESGYNSKGKYYGDYINLDSFVRRFVVDCVMNNADMLDRSCYFYIDVENDGNFGKEVLYAGPAWDYDFCKMKTKTLFFFKQYLAGGLSGPGRQEWAKAFMKRGDFMHKMEELSDGDLKQEWELLRASLPDTIQSFLPSQKMNQVLWNNDFLYGANDIKFDFSTERYNYWYNTFFNETEKLLGVAVSYHEESNTLQANIVGCGDNIQWYTVGDDGTKTNIENANQKNYTVPTGSQAVRYGVSVTGANPAEDCYADSEQITMYSNPIELGHRILFQSADNMTTDTEFLVAPGGSLPNDRWPAVPEKKGYTGTWNVQELVNVTKDVIVEATYTPNTYTVIYEGNNADAGNMIPGIHYYDTEDTLRLNEYTKNGYRFKEWNTRANGRGESYTDGETVFNLSAENHGEIKLYAQWEALSYKITYQGLYDVSHDNPAFYYSDASVTLTQPVRRGYDFLGWTWEGQSVPVKFVTLKRGSFGDKVFVANWMAQVYKVTYTGLAGAEHSNPAEYTVETEKTMLQAPVREGYVFTGWTWDDQTKPVMEVTIGGGSRGDKTFTANWEKMQTPDPKPDDTSGSLKPTPNTDNQTQTVQLPTAPAKVTTALYGYDDIKVTWSAATGATSYQVYMKKGSGAYTLATTTSSLSYKAKNLADGAKYTFKVVAYNGTLAGGEKASSAIYTLKKVTGVKVVKSGSKVKVSWKNIEGETGYQISKMTTKKGTQKKPTTYKTTKGKYKKLAATKGKTYYYKVRAYKTVNGKKIYGPWSAVKKFKRK